MAEFAEVSPPGLQMDAFSLCPHVAVSSFLIRA